MSTRPTMIVVLLAAGLFVTGCGPTKAGIKARNEAYGRMNRVNGQLNFDQAQRAFEAAQFDKALNSVGVAIELNPEAAEYRVLKGRIYLETHRLEEAVRSFDAALELQSQIADAHYYAGIVFQRWSDDERAYERYLAASELEPGSVIYLLATAETMVGLNQLEEAKALIESRLDYFEHNASLRHLQGQIALLEGDAAKAAALYADAWRLNSDDEMLLEQLADAQYAAGMYAKCYDSIGELKRRVGKDRVDLLMFEARCLTYMDRLDESRNLYLELTRKRPTDPDVWIELGTLSWDADDFHRVARCGARLTALAPERYEGYLLKGINEHHHGNLAEAIMLFQQAVARAQDTVLPHLALGRVFEETGDPESARDAYEVALSLDPHNADAQTLLADLDRRQAVVNVPSVERDHE